MKKNNLKELISNLPKHPNVLGRNRFFNSAVLIPLVKIAITNQSDFLFVKRKWQHVILRMVITV